MNMTVTIATSVKVFPIVDKDIELRIDDHYLEDLYLSAISDGVRHMILSS